MATIPELRPHAVEYIKWAYTGPIGPIEISLDGGTTWVATETVPNEPKSFRVLFAGSLAPAVSGAKVLQPGKFNVIARLTDSPEIVPRSAGFIRVLAGGY